MRWSAFGNSRSERDSATRSRVSRGAPTPPRAMLEAAANPQMFGELVAAGALFEEEFSGPVENND